MLHNATVPTWKSRSLKAAFKKQNKTKLQCEVNLHSIQDLASRIEPGLSPLDKGIGIVIYLSILLGIPCWLRISAMS